MRRNVEGQKEQELKFHSNLKQTTVKSTGRLAVLLRLVLILGLVVVFLELFTTQAIKFHFSSKNEGEI